MEHIVVVNKAVCQVIRPGTILIYGRKKRIFTSSGKLVENHILTGKWASLKITEGARR